ncbi:hypothetical protein BCR37DRAFT_375478 [Protomyces lactucae-debilis]|uniref:USP domain-containing protein n=1 Tax=Protomyces lactucae-debilis TaxID=2754530 RepID=A0A1Y2FVM8_PROLT|nr:uncharacterized protein BCR37DRAFT_375478 [Protomyces lactucae-debilis]ORY87617.1 hypothetical protein BCR37DRAFT_375478 [Protomyces lactucae-debilis]
MTQQHQPEAPEPLAKKRKLETAEDATDNKGAQTIPMYPAREKENPNLYLETVHRELLEPDAARLCSVTLADTNVYACLSCGEYLQGRGKATPAYAHSLDTDHRLFLRTTDSVIYVLPEGSLCKSLLLHDIKQAYNPFYSQTDLNGLDTLELHETRPGIYHGPGLIPIHKLGRDGALNAIFHALSHVRILRSKLLQLPNDRDYYAGLPPLLQELSLLFRKLWRRGLRNHVSAVQAAARMSHTSLGVFAQEKKLVPALVLAFLLDTLHRQLGGSRTKPAPISMDTADEKIELPRCAKHTIISTGMQGVLLIQTQKIQELTDAQAPQLRFRDDPNAEATLVPYKILALTLPPIPVFAGGDPGAVSAQLCVTLTTLLERYSGNQFEQLGNTRRRYKLLFLPEKTLIFSIQRTVEGEAHRNRVIVQLPITIDMSPLLVKPQGPALFDLFTVIMQDPLTDDWFAYTKRMVGTQARWFKVCAGMEARQVPASELFVGEANIAFYERQTS